MGPPREHGGWILNDDGTATEDSLLQWGRRVNTADGRVEPGPTTHPAGFNGAAA